MIVARVDQAGFMYHPQCAELMGGSGWVDIEESWRVHSWERCIRCQEVILYSQREESDDELEESEPWENDRDEEDDHGSKD